MKLKNNNNNNKLKIKSSTETNEFDQDPVSVHLSELLAKYLTSQLTDLRHLEST